MVRQKAVEEMRALVTRLAGGGRREKVLVADWPEPDRPVGNQVKTQTVYSGVTNGSERNDLVGGNYANKDEALPAGWGYQNVGRVVACGPDVQLLKVGDLLFMSKGHLEYVVVPEDGLLVKLPPSVDATHAALFGISSVAMRICRHADLRLGERVLIVGAGLLGQVAAQVAAAMGASVSICDIDEKRLGMARSIGAAEGAYDVTGAGWDQHVGEGCFDAVIDAAGVPDQEDKLISAVRRLGRVLFIAGRFRLSYTFNIGNELEVTIKQSRHFDRRDLADTCRLVAQGRVRIGPLIQDVVPVIDANRIYELLRDAPAALFGTVFTWSKG
jgi:2-desacetyl-2-hydroxyethyl bacteriochlorophyllide A dehydrogenase